jgi:hypothetical protein
MSETMAVRRRREIEFLARELFVQVQDLMAAVGDLVPAELAGGDGHLAAGTAMRAVADRIDEALLCFDLLQEEMGLRPGAGPMFARMRGARGDGPTAHAAGTSPQPAGRPARPLQECGQPS